MEELVTRTATLEPTTFDPERRTVEVVFATTAPVRRFDLEGPYQERLDLSPKAVDLSQLIGGPVLNSHDRMDVNSILGVVESAQVDGERGVARLRFSERAAAILNDIRDGIIRSISVGYAVNQRRVEKDPATGIRTIVATAWTGKEISLVAIGAGGVSMALSLNELQGMRDALIAAIGSGTLRVEFEGRSMTYRSVAEMQAALTTINKEIEQAGGGSTSPRQVVITPKGI